MDPKNNETLGGHKTSFSFSSRVALAIGLICLAPLLVGHALTQYTRGDENDYFLALVLFLMLTTTLMTVLLLRTDPVQAAPFLLMGLVLLLAVYLRAVCLDRATNDYESFLSKWLLEMREKGGFAALGEMTSSDYNVPYLYILALFSYLPVDHLLLIKFVSIIGDFVMAWAAMSLVKELGFSEKKRLFVLAGLLFAPTIWLNSAYWGQCNALYALFALKSMLYILRGRPWHAVAMAGVAFAFKLQTIFFLPMLIVFLMTKRIKWKHLLAFPGVFLVVCAPALALGRPFVSLFTIYFGQASQYSQYLNLKSPSLYALLGFNDWNDTPSVPVAPLFMAGIITAAMVLIYMLYWLSQRTKPIDNHALMTLALFFCVAIPWCLPSMHERYFYLADVFAVIYAVIYPKRFYIAPMVIYASYAGYNAYLFGRWLQFAMWLPSILIVLVAGFLIIDLRSRYKGDGAATGPAPLGDGRTYEQQVIDVIEMIEGTKDE